MKKDHQHDQGRAAFNKHSLYPNMLKLNETNSPDITASLYFYLKITIL
jgi:hypothetical protein